MKRSQLLQEGKSPLLVDYDLLDQFCDASVTPSHSNIFLQFLSATRLSLVSNYHHAWYLQSRHHWTHVSHGSIMHFLEQALTECHKEWHAMKELCHVLDRHTTMRPLVEEILREDPVLHDSMMWSIKNEWNRYIDKTHLGGLFFRVPILLTHATLSLDLALAFYGVASLPPQKRILLQKPSRHTMLGQLLLYDDTTPTTTTTTTSLYRIRLPKETFPLGETRLYTDEWVNLDALVPFEQSMFMGSISLSKRLYAMTPIECVALPVAEVAGRIAASQRLRKSLIELYFSTRKRKKNDQWQFYDLNAYIK